MAGVDLVMEILNTAPKVMVLVTSREPLKFQAERVMRIEGLPVPPAQHEAEAEHYSSVRLFIDRAGRAADEFALTTENMRSVIEICRLTDGLPLGIVLAAAQMYSRSPQAVAQAIGENVDALAVLMGDLPPRQRSIRAVFEWSWGLLTPKEQSALAQVSVFRGGFIESAAQIVGGATSSELQSLVDKSLVRQAESGRYDMHELWRQIASEKLSAPERQDTLARHSRFFMMYAGAQAPHLNGLQPRIALMEMRVEIDNIREAWHWAVVNKNNEALNVGLGGLADFYDLSGLILEGAREIETAIGSIVPATPAQASTLLRRLSARLWAELARFHSLHYAAETTIEAAKQSVLWAQTAEVPEVEARARLYWGLGLWRLADFTAARAHIDSALALATQCHNADIEADGYRALGFVADSLGHYDEARSHQMQALELFRKVNDAQGECNVSASLGNIAWSQGDLMASIDYQSQALRLSQQTGNRFDEGDALHNMGNVMHSVGDYAKAQTYFQRSRDVAHEIGLPEYTLSITAINLALVLHHIGENEAAQRESLRALKLARQAGMRREEGLALTCLGHALAGLNLHTEAAQIYRNALSLQRELGQHNLAMEPLAGLARVALAQGELAPTRQYVEEILQHLELGNLEGADEPFRVYLTCYRVLWAHDDPRAPGILRMAHDLLQARAAMIGDERLQRSFLENVPVHRELVREFSR
jgi:predicted ATPase/Tfp pilus assembly protein PilF